MMKLTPQMLPVQIDANAVDPPKDAGPPFELPEDGWSDDAQASSASDDYQASAAEADRAAADDRKVLDESSEGQDEQASADGLREVSAWDDQDETRDQGPDDGEDERPLLMAVHAAENARDLSRRRLGQRALANASQRPVGEGAEGSARRSTGAEAKLQTGEAAGTRFAGSEGSEKASTEERVAGSKLEPVARKDQADRSKGRRTNNATVDKLAQMRAVDRAARTARGDIARDLLENVMEARMDEARASDRVSRATVRGEGVRTALTENVISEVHKVFKKASDKRTQVLERAREKDAMARAGGGEESTEGEKAAAGRAPTSTMAGPIAGAATVAPTSGAASVPGQGIPQPQPLDPAVAEALRNVRTEDPGDTVLKLRQTTVGQLEVRIRAAGDGLIVLVKAEETALRHKMVEGLSELRSALDKAELVAGRVDVAEYGAFENETRGESRGQDFSQSSFEESLERHASDENDGQNAKPDNSTHDEDSTSSSPSSTTARAEDGRLHVIV